MKPVTELSEDVSRDQSNLRSGQGGQGVLQRV